jgi:hypothetical protein
LKCQIILNSNVLCNLGNLRVVWQDKKGMIVTKTFDGFITYEQADKIAKQNDWKTIIILILLFFS